MINSKQNAWNFASLFVYFILLVLVGYLLEREKIDITSLTFRDLAFITLATYRLTRIVVFEKIFKFCRDFVRARQDYKVFNTIRYIITCPWCAGVWMALVTCGLLPAGALRQIPGIHPRHFRRGFLPYHAGQCRRTDRGGKTIEGEEGLRL